MENFDLIKKKAKKLKALADRGIKGEKETAQAFLEEFMKKHKLTDEDVDDNAFIRLFKRKGLDYDTIVTHSIMSVNPFCKLDFDEEKKNYKVTLDDVDYNEVEYKTNFFYDLFYKELDRLFDTFKEDTMFFQKKSDDFEKELFFTAFITKHREYFQPDRDAFVKHQPKQKPMSKKEAQAMRKAEQEAEKAFKERQKEEEKKNKDKKKDKSEQPPTPIDYSDMNRIYAIIELMGDANYVKVRNVLPVYIKKIENEKQKKRKK